MAADVRMLVKAKSRDIDYLEEQLLSSETLPGNGQVKTESEKYIHTCTT